MSCSATASHTGGEQRPSRIASSFDVVITVICWAKLRLKGRSSTVPGNCRRPTDKRRRLPVYTAAFGPYPFERPQTRDCFPEIMICHADIGEHVGIAAVHCVQSLA